MLPDRGKGITHIIAKLLRTHLVICSHSREGKTPCCSQINTICFHGEQIYEKI